MTFISCNRKTLLKLLILAPFSLPLFSSAQVLPIPLNAASYNMDLVADGTGSDVTSVTGGAFDNANHVFYSTQFRLANSAVITGGGLPDNGTITNGPDSWQIAPYGGNQCLYFGPQFASTMASLTLAVPGSYNQISLLAAAAGGSCFADISVHFTDGSNTVFPNQTVTDWFVGTGGVIKSLGRIPRVNPVSSFDGYPANPCLYAISLLFNSADQVKLIDRIDITDQSINNQATIAIFGLSGTQTVLSLGLSDLQGTYQAPQKAVHLQWQAPSVLPGETFEIQRSFTGAGFTTIGSLSPGDVAISSLFTYDDAVASGDASKVFYRIKDQKVGEPASYSAAIAIVIHDPADIRLVNSNGSLVFSGRLDGTAYTYTIFTDGGQLLQKGSFVPGNTISVNALPAGVYFLVLRAGQQSWPFKFLK